MKRIILLVLLIPALTYAQRYGHTAAGGTFVWSLSGEAIASDSIRYIPGTNITMSQSGNTLTINGAAGAGSTGRTAWYDTDGDSVVIQLDPQHLYFLQAKDGATILFSVDSLGNIRSEARAGFGVATGGQAARAFLNVIGFGDTLAIFTGEGSKGLGDSTAYIFANGNALFNTSVTVANPTTASGLIFGTEVVVGRRTSEVGTFGINHDFNAIGGMVGIGSIFNTTATARYQGLLTVRPTGATSDTLFMARNDVNSTLDSTAMVFADGRIYRSDTKQLPAGAWLATASNGAALSSSNYIVTYAFDQTTAETLTVDFALPPNFGMINNVEIEVISPNTDGDSVGYAVAWLGRAADEAFDVAFSSALSGQIDLGTTANVRKILTISGTFSNLAASDRIIFKLWRDPSVDNNVAADVHFVDMRVNGAGLLH